MCEREGKREDGYCGGLGGWEIDEMRYYMDMVVEE